MDKIGLRNPWLASLVPALPDGDVTGRMEHKRMQEALFAGIAIAGALSPHVATGTLFDPECCHYNARTVASPTAPIGISLTIEKAWGANPRAVVSLYSYQDNTKDFDAMGPLGEAGIGIERLSAYTIATTIKRLVKALDMPTLMVKVSKRMMARLDRENAVMAASNKLAAVGIDIRERAGDNLGIHYNVGDLYIYGRLSYDGTTVSLDRATMPVDALVALMKYVNKEAA